MTNGKDEDDMEIDTSQDSEPQATPSTSCALEAQKAMTSSFLSMGARGSASLYVVAPGIADALITTVFGLGAAIPAVIGYNYIVRVIRRREEKVGLFTVRFRTRLLEKRYS